MKHFFTMSFSKRYPIIVLLVIGACVIAISLLTISTLSHLQKLSLEYSKRQSFEYVESSSLIIHDFIKRAMHFNYTKNNELFIPIRNNSAIYAAYVIKPTDDDRYYEVTKVIKGNSLHNKLTRMDTSDNYLLRKGFAHVTVNPVIHTENTISYIESYIPLLQNGKTYCIIIQWLAPDTILLQQKHSNEVTSLTQTVAIVIAVTFIVIACISLVHMYRTKSLIKELSHSIQSLASGSLDIALNDSVESELKDIAQSFNSLVANIKNKEQMLQTIKEETFADIFKRGVSNLKEMKLDEACACFQVMIMYKPTSFASLFNLGVCFAKKGDFKTSLQYFMKAKELNPENELTMRYIDKLQTFI